MSYEDELQKHITLMGKVQYGMEREGWVYVEQFKEAMRFFIDHLIDLKQEKETKLHDASQVPAHKGTNIPKFMVKEEKLK